MRDLDYKGADVCIIVYSIDKESTIDKVPDIIDIVENICGDKMPMIWLVGNKVDLDAKGMRAVTKEDAESLKAELIDEKTNLPKI